MKDPAALFYIDLWLTSTAGMDADTRGWYLNLILHQYDKKDLPNNIEELAVLAGVKYSEFKRFEQVFEQVFKQKFSITMSGRLENQVASEIIRRREMFKDKRSISGKMSYFIRYITKSYKPRKDELTYIKENVDLSNVDLKDEHLLKQTFEQIRELYINGNVDNIILWKKDYNIYIEGLNNYFESIKNDNEFILEQEKYNPGIEIILTIEKSIKNFWGTEAGWKNKKKSGNNNIDWPATLKNALTLPANKIYKQKNGSPNLFSNPLLVKVDTSSKGGFDFSYKNK